MEATILPEDQFPKWDTFVESHPNGTIYHSSEWKHGLESAFSHIRGYFIAIISPVENAIVAGIPIYRVHSRLLGTRLVCAPYATWCDPLYSEADHLPILLKKVKELAKSTNSKRVEIRLLRETRNPHSSLGSSIRPASLHHWIDLEPGTDAIWKGLPHNSIRRLINRADKSGVVISSHSDKGSIEEFYACLIDSRNRLGLPMIPKEYFLSLRDSISASSLRILIARKGSQTLAAALFLIRNGICHLEFTGEFTDTKQPGTLHLIKWEAIRMACRDGYKEFSLGRTTFENEGLIEYKRRWYTQEETIQILSLDDRVDDKCIQSNSPLTPMIKVINRILPRRLYLSLGSYLYKHMG